MAILLTLQNGKMILIILQKKCLTVKSKSMRVIVKYFNQHNPLPKNLVIQSDIPFKNSLPLFFVFRFNEEFINARCAAVISDLEFANHIGGLESFIPGQRTDRVFWIKNTRMRLTRYLLRLKKKKKINSQVNRNVHVDWTIQMIQTINDHQRLINFSQDKFPYDLRRSSTPFWFRRKNHNKTKSNIWRYSCWNNPSSEFQVPSDN